jgi:hypothetical protein
MAYTVNGQPQVSQEAYPGKPLLQRSTLEAMSMAELRDLAPGKAKTKAGLIDMILEAQ